MASHIETDKIFLRCIDGTLTGISNLGQSGLGNNGKEEVIHVLGSNLGHSFG